MTFTKRFKFLIFLAAAGLSIYGAIRLYFHLTDGFRIENITSSFQYNERWTTVPLTEVEMSGVDSILSQEFHYLGKGCQSYVFESQDGNYVLKFFKYQRYKSKTLLDCFTFIPFVQNIKRAKTAKKTKKLEGVFHSWTVAFNHARDETGLLYVHLNKTDYLHKNLTIFDKMGSKHVLDIDHFEFLIQKKATMITEYIQGMMGEKKEPEAHAFLETLVDMIKGEYNRGIADNDPALMQNTGVISGKPIHVDVGQFDISEKYRDPSLYKVEIFQKFFKFRRWLSEKYPSLGQSLDQRLNKEFGEEFFRIPPNPRYLSVRGNGSLTSMPFFHACGCFGQRGQASLDLCPHLPAP